MYDMANIKKLGKLGVAQNDAWAKFQEFNNAAMAEGALPKKTKELIALAVALTTQCPYCLELHKDAALKAGATEEELAEVTLVTAALRAGAGVTHGTHLVG